MLGDSVGHNGLSKSGLMKESWAILPMDTTGPRPESPNISVHIKKFET